jgi:hypothetical protein
MHFTVITPTFKRRALLPETIASVRASISAPLNFSFEHLLYPKPPPSPTRPCATGSTPTPSAPALPVTS